MLFEAFAWFWIGLGILSGAVIGVFFRNDTFLGGYDSWRRRLLRLGHIAFFGTGILCLMLASTLSRHPMAHALQHWVLISMVVGAMGMPLICAIAAFRPRLTPLFVVPVLALGFGVTATYIHLLILWWHSSASTTTGAAP